MREHIVKFPEPDTYGIRKWTIFGYRYLHLHNLTGDFWCKRSKGYTYGNKKYVTYKFKNHKQETKDYKRRVKENRQLAKGVIVK